MPVSPLLGLVLVSVLGSPVLEPAPVPSVRYQVHAWVEDQRISGVLHVTVVNTSNEDIRELLLQLYANRYAAEVAGAEDTNLLRLYPNGTSRGGMHVISLGGTLSDIPVEGVDIGVVKRVELARAVPPGGSAELDLGFVTTFPEKFGSYGRVEDVLLANGGWFPQIVAVPAREKAGGAAFEVLSADFDVQLETAGNALLVLHDQIFPPKPPDEGIHRARVLVPHANGVLLAVAPRANVTSRDGLRYVQLTGGSRHAERVLGVWARARSWARLQGLKIPSDVTVLEAPLTRELVLVTESLPLLSFRTYRLWGPARRYHDLHVARAFFASAFAHHTGAHEAGLASIDINEGVSMNLAKRFMASEGKLRDPRDYIRPFAWIPAIDLALYGEQFPFVAEYYGNFYWRDPLADDPPRYGQVRGSGMVPFEKLSDLVGEEALNRVVDAYLTSTNPSERFDTLASARLSQDLSTFFELWRGPIPAVNYRVEGFESVRLEGAWQTRVRLDSDGPDAGDKVKVRVESRGHTDDVTWEPKGGEAEVEIASRRKPRSVVLDPEGRLYETVRWDNQLPRPWKLVLQYAYVDVDFKIQEVAGGAGIELQRTWDPRNELDASAFWTQESVGAELGYARSFGPRTWYRGLKHVVGIGLIAEMLDQDFARDGLNVTRGFDPEASEVDASVGVNIGYRYESRRDFRWPRYGTRFFAGLESGVGVSGPENPYHIWRIHALRLVPVTDTHVIAFQGIAGSFFATRTSAIPLPKLFFIGGIRGLRGMSEPEIVGPTRALLSGEWRWYAIRNLDFDLSLVRLRGVQPVIFADLGYVSSGVEDVPDVRNWLSDVGTGLRLHMDALGIRPMVARFDLAQRTDTYYRGEGKADTRFYIFMDQSF